MKKPLLIIITGPTASGKSALAVSLALRLKTEIISADSRQIFKGIPIVTAVPSEEEKCGIRHHLLEVLNLDDYYSAAKFQEDSDCILKNIFRNQDIAIMCGGSMLYLDALVKGIDELPTVPQELRKALIEDWNKNGDEWLLDKLLEVDNAYYHKIDHRNLKRVFHAVEISILSGLPYSSLLTKNHNYESINKELSFNVVKFCLNGEREKLFSRINNRVKNMIEQGLVEEAKNVYHLRHLNSLNTVGLKEMFAYFDNELSFDETVARIQKNTRVYAKKQLTWHKRDDNLIYLNFADNKNINVEKILNYIK